MVAAAIFILAGAGASAAETTPRPEAEPVPSLEPAATDALWRELVRRRASKTQPAEEDVACRPMRIVFYAATDWLRLATKLAASASPCADYYISVPPLAADKTQPRADQAWRIRALGPRFHALAEVSWNGWSGWVSTTGSTWYQAGVEARRRVALAGYDTALGDRWALNELSSAVRIGNGNARANALSFLRGLHRGDGISEPVRGVAFIAGIGQPTGELSVYQTRLQDWLEDGAFWREAAGYVSDWSQEVYGDIRNYAVPGAPLEERRAALSEYLQHELALARAGPAPAADARTMLESVYSPLANAAWRFDASFGWTDVSFDLMQHYVSAQTYALRHGAAGRAVDRGGFAWSPKNLAGLPSAEFTSQTGALLDRLAAALRDSGQPLDPADPGVGACGSALQNVWCRGDLEGASLNRGWGSFATWRPAQLAFRTAPQTIATGATSSPMTVELRTYSGVVLTVSAPLAVELYSSSATAELASAPGGPWARTLAVTIPTSASTVTFYYRDTTAGSPVVTASAAGKRAASQEQSIVAAAPPFDGGLLRNGSFDESLAGWRGVNTTPERVPAAAGGFAARVASTGVSMYGLLTEPRPVPVPAAGEAYRASAQMRADRPGKTVCLAIREWNPEGTTLVGSARSCAVARFEWGSLPEVRYATTVAGSSLDVLVWQSGAAAGESFDVDSVALFGPAYSPGLLSNGSFEGTSSGWAAWNSTLGFVAGAIGAQALRVTPASSATTYGAITAPRPVAPVEVGRTYRSTAELRSEASGVTVCLAIREWAADGRSIVGSAKTCALLGPGWQRLPVVSYRATVDRGLLDVLVWRSNARAGESFVVDAVTMR